MYACTLTCAKVCVHMCMSACVFVCTRAPIWVHVQGRPHVHAYKHVTNATGNEQNTILSPVLNLHFNVNTLLYVAI